MWKHLSCICINNTHNQISPAYTELSIKHKHDQFMLSSVSSQIPPVPTSWLCLARYGSRLWKWSGEGSVTAGGSNESINCSRTDQSQLVSLYLASKKVLPSSHPSKSQHHLKPRIWNQHRVLCSFRNLPQPSRQIHPQVNLTLVWQIIEQHLGNPGNKPLAIHCRDKSRRQQINRDSAMANRG